MRQMPTTRSGTTERFSQAVSARVTRPVLIATTNPAKRERLRALLDGWNVPCRGLETLAPVPSPEETGADHLQNALLKAGYWSERSAGLALASDGGMAIPALGPTWNSLTTHRAAGDVDSDEERVAHLLRLTTSLEGEDRAAIWEEAVALADRGQTLRWWQVQGPKGYLLSSPRPARIPGFWVASLWHFPQLGKAYTELSSKELERIGDPWVRLREQVQADLRAGRLAF